jgi:hypothetical protein
MLKIKSKYSWLVALIIMVTFLLLRLTSPPKNILSYDVFGYYLYLPAIFIYDDPGLRNIDWVKEVNEKYGGAPSLYQLAKVSDTNYAIRFYSGIAIMYTPFFLAGHAIAQLTDYETDGFSKPYQWAIIIAGIFYTLIGVWLMRKFLISMFSDKVAALTLLLIFIGSNVFFFCTWGNDAPHIYIFTLYSAILWLTSLWMKGPKTGYAIILGLISGITVITRASEVLILSIPVLWGMWGANSTRYKIKMFWTQKKDVIFFILFMILGALPQFIYWKLTTGVWVYNAYDDPQSGFNFDQPRIAYILFGFRKGLYIYSPMMIVATIGFYHLLKQKRELFLAVLIFFLANVYLIASYSSLISYGWRAFVQAHAVLAIPLGCLVSWTMIQKKTPKALILLFLLLLLILNVFKSWQTSQGIIDGSRMTREYYLDSFLATDPQKVNKELLLVNRSNETIETLQNAELYSDRTVVSYNFETLPMGWPDHRDTNFAYEGSYSFKLDTKNIYSPAVEIPFQDLTSNYYCWLRASVWVYKPENSLKDESLLVVHFNYQGRAYKYRAVSFKNQDIEFKPGEWNRISIDYMTPEVRTKEDPVKLYVWYRGKGEIFIDNLTLEVFEPEERR